MKYVILIGDGMSDLPVDALGGKTPLEHAATPNLDRLAACGSLGLFGSVPEGFSPGSDVANLSILGYAPEKYYTGRAPLEAASIGVKLGPTDVAFRCNLVTLVERKGETVMDDYSAGHISTGEAAEIITALDKALSGEGVRFYPGTSYRHLMVWEDAPELKGLEVTPPHDISDRSIAGSFPRGRGEKRLTRLMELARDILRNNPVNRARLTAGKKPANSIWLWGFGTAPRMPTMRERFGVEGSIISAVDLMKGIGIYAGLEVLDVPGVTGYIDTNYRGKAEAALASLETKDFVVVHVEAPDEAGHQGSLEDKLTAIEDFDREIVGRVLEGLDSDRFDEYTVLALNDHPTPVALKTHTSEPVPFVLYRSEDPAGGGGGGGGAGGADDGPGFSEEAAASTGLRCDDCGRFMEEFFGRPAMV